MLSSNRAPARRWLRWELKRANVFYKNAIEFYRPKKIG